MEETHIACFLITFVIFIGLGRAYRLGGGSREILKLSYGRGKGGQTKKGRDHFMGEVDPSRHHVKFNLAIVGGLGWMK